MHDQTAVNTEGISDLFEQYPKVDAGYRGLAKRFPHQVQAPPKKPVKDAPMAEIKAWAEARKQQSSERICVEHANAEHKSVAAPPAAHRTPRVLRRDPPGDRRPRLRPHRTAVITHQGTDPPGQHAPTSVAHHTVISVFRQDGQTNITAALRHTVRDYHRPLQALGLT